MKPSLFAKLYTILKFGWLRLLLILGCAALCFYWLTGGVVNLNFFDLWYKLNDFIDKNMALGGWHRALMIIAVTSPVWLTVVIMAQRKKG